MVADFDWNAVSDWPRDGVMRWWDEGWDWESLKKKPYPHPDYKTYAGYYAQTFRFPDPRDETKTITEAKYWGERWLTKFADKEWDIYHLPTFDPKTGDKSPKHHAYEGDDQWSDEDRAAFALGLKVRMEAGQRVGRHAPLSGIVTPQETNLGLSEKPVHVVFSGALFGVGAYFTSARFGDGAVFAKAQFGAFADFSSAQFGNNAHFTAAQFGDGANFSSARFGDGADFSSAQFGDEADFTAAQFGDGAILSGARFGEFAKLSGAQFGDFANLYGAQFGDGAKLSGARFGNRAMFNNARFLGRVDFSLGAAPKDGQRSGRLAPDAPTDKAPPAHTLRMDKQQDWAAERAFREISFKGSEFWGDADFTNRRFTGPTDFSSAIFYGLANFYEATLHKRTIFTIREGNFFPAPGGIPRANISDMDEDEPASNRLEQQRRALDHWRHVHSALSKEKRDWHRPPPRSYENRNSSAPGSDHWSARCADFEQAYRCLKIMMQEMGARSEWQFFNTLEIKSRLRRPDIPITEKFFDTLYTAISGYGQSISRPLFWILIGWPLIVLVLLFCLTVFGTPGILHSDAISHSIHFVVRNLIPGFGLNDVIQGCSVETCFQLSYQEWIDGFISSGWFVRALFYLIATLDTAVNLALWFLFSLALRRRFQIS